MKKFVIFLSLLLILSACNADTSEASSSEPEEINQEVQTVNFWYDTNEQTSTLIEKVVQEYNSTAQLYNIVAKKTANEDILTAIASGTGPDLSLCYGDDVPLYAVSNIAMPIDELISSAAFDKTALVEKALEQQKYNGNIYALPLTIDVYSVFYNKTLLSAKKIATTPKTLEELEKLSATLTTVKAGEITYFAYPYLSNTAFVYSYLYASGGNFGTETQLNFASEEFKKTLQKIVSVREKVGAASLNNYITDGSINLYTEKDPFLAGEQIIRIDNFAFLHSLKDTELDFEVTQMPGLSSEGYSYIETSSVFIPSNSICKEGAFDFAVYLTDKFSTNAVEINAIPANIQAINALKASEQDANYLAFYDTALGQNLNFLPRVSYILDIKSAIEKAVYSVIYGSDIEITLNKLTETQNKLKEENVAIIAPEQAENSSSNVTA